jgi:short-subunit dehydrogenase
MSATLDFMARRFQERVVIITGASSGIGAALARKFASEGADVVLAARRTDRLEEVAIELRKLGKRALVCTCDVTKSGDLERTAEQAIEQFGRIDIVVANAGFGVVGELEKLSLEDYRRQFETNVFGVLRTAQAMIPALRRSKGTFAILGSVAGHIGLPGASAYSMSKFAVRALAQSMRYELRPDKISVVLISPGFVESEIRSVNNQGTIVKAEPDKRPRWLVMETAVAANHIVTGIAKRKKEVVITAHGKLVVLLGRLIPGVFDLVVALGIRGRRQLPDSESSADSAS